MAGDVEIANQPLKTRDGLGIWDVAEVNLKAKSNTSLLVMEVPMSF